MDVTLREVTSGVGGYANVSLNMQLELHISAIVVHVQLLWCGYVDNNGTGAKLSRLLCAAFLFSLESAAVSCIIAVWGAFESGCFPFPCLQVATFFLQPTRQLAKCCRWSRQPQSCNWLLVHARTHALQVLCQPSVKCLKTC